MDDKEVYILQLENTIKSLEQQVDNSCDVSTYLGRCDKVMILMLYNTDMRISQLICIKQKDVSITENHGVVSVLGKVCT